MSRKAIMALVLLLVAVVPSSVTQVVSVESMAWPERSGLVVMTFNVRTSFAADLVNNWIFRRKLVAHVIREEVPDILMLQEANPLQLAAIKKDVPGFRIATAGIGSQWLGYPVVMFRADRFEVIDSERLWFSEAPRVSDSISWGNKVPRCFTAVTLLDKKSGRKLVAVSTHLDYLSPSSREESVKLMGGWCKEASDLPLIVGGDFNEPADSSVLDRLRSTRPISEIYRQRLLDAYRMAHEPEKGTLHGFTGKAAKRIDLILVSPEWRVTESRVVEYHKGLLYPSDHYPVVAELEYPQPQPELAGSFKPAIIE